MKKYLFLFFLLTSCIKEKTTSFRVTMHNKSSHDIKLCFYNYGKVGLGDTLHIKKGESIPIGTGWHRGILDRGGFYLKHNGDSVVVTFNDSLQMTHYTKTPLTPVKKSYLYSSIRNVLNYLSYEYKHEDTSKWSRLAHYDYIFTDQDYLDAK